jgi:hypothetical protein
MGVGLVGVVLQHYVAVEAVVLLLVQQLLMFSLEEGSLASAILPRVLLGILLLHLLLCLALCAATGLRHFSIAVVVAIHADDFSHRAPPACLLSRLRFPPSHADGRSGDLEAARSSTMITSRMSVFKEASWARS